MDEAHLSCITDVSIGNCEMKVDNLTSSDMLVGKFKSNKKLEGIARQGTQLASKHKWTETGKLQSETNCI